MGLGTKLDGAISDTLKNYVNDKSAALCVDLIPIAITGITIHLILMGFMIMRGGSDDSLHTLLSKWMRIAVVGSIALSGGAYQTMIVDSATGLEVALIKSLTGKSSMGVLIDDFAEPFEVLGNQIWNEAVNDSIPNLTLCAAAAMVAIAEFFLIPISLGLYLLAKVAFSITLAVGPAFVLCAMWPATEKYAESWIGQVVNYILLKALIAACIGILMFLASDYAQHIADRGELVNILSSCASLLMCSVALGIVLLNLPQIASALAGGASLSGIGRHVGRAFMNFTKAKEAAPPSGGGEIAPRRGGSGGRGGRTEPSSPRTQPLYKTNTLSMLNKK